MQALPPAPQVGAPVPALQVPLLQQPPLQACVGLQAVVQVWMVASQAWLDGQSAAPPQPQAPPPATAMQTAPAGLVEQGVQAPPELPQVPSSVPTEQTPPSQQPPWQSCVGLQAPVHWCVKVSQAMPEGQSAAALQPQALARHRWPLLLTVQSTQAPPAAPHAGAELPTLHVPARQQPPEHGWPALQPVVH
jgi:hypothetical protein